MDFLIIPALALWNRFRGSGWVPHGGEWAWVILPSVVFLWSLDPVFTAIVTLGSFLSFRLSWGWLLDMNRRPTAPGTSGYAWASDDTRWNIWYVKVIYKLSGGDDYKGMILRHLFIAPMFVGLWYFDYINMFVAAVLTVVHAVTYASLWWIGGKASDRGIGNIVLNGELLGGATFGIVLLLARVL